MLTLVEFPHPSAESPGTLKRRKKQRVSWLVETPLKPWMGWLVQMMMNFPTLGGYFRPIFEGGAKMATEKVFLFPEGSCTSDWVHLETMSPIFVP